MPSYRAALVLVLSLLAACKGTASPNDATLSRDSMSAQVVVPEVHLFDLADSTQVWLAEGRAAHASGGERCIERSIQLRKGPLKIPVPLLYTSSLPEVVDGQLVAKLSKDCVTGAAYSIDPKTGQPTLLAPASR